MNVSNRNYGKFTPVERCKLALSALNRDDLNEAQRLWETAPMHEYRAKDLTFRKHMMAIMAVSGLFFQQCVKHYNAIIKARDFIYDSHRMSEYEEPDESLIEMADCIKNVEIAKLKGLYRAMREFCTEAELNYDDVMKQIPIKESHIYVDQFLSANIAMSDAYRDEIKGLFMESWEF